MPFVEIKSQSIHTTRNLCTFGIIISGLGMGQMNGGHGSYNIRMFIIRALRGIMQ